MDLERFKVLLVKEYDKLIPFFQMDGKTLALIFLGETKEKKKQQLYS
jgi:hypothetical protein